MYLVASIISIIPQIILIDILQYNKLTILFVLIIGVYGHKTNRFLFCIRLAEKVHFLLVI